MTKLRKWINNIFTKEKMKNIIVFLLIVFGMVFFSCNNRRENTNNSEESIVEYFEIPILELQQEEMDIQYRYIQFPVCIEFDISSSDFILGHGQNMISNIESIYAPESCEILNLEEIQNIAIENIFYNPILNTNMFLPCHWSPRDNIFRNIDDLLNIFDIVLSQEEIDRIDANRANGFGSGSIRISTEYMSLYIEKSQFHFRLWMLEYDKISSVYDFNIKIGTGKEEIISRFGIPSRQTEQGHIFDYVSFKSLRSMIILFYDEKVKKVQLIASDGI